MLKFFKYSGPVQLGALFLLALVLRIPLLVAEIPLLTEDLHHLVIGEKMADGFLIYRDIIDSTAPLSAFVYWFVCFVFGKSLAAFYFISFLLIFVQSQIFKYLCNSNDLMQQKGDLPALIYIVCCSICFDFFSLSPCLISITFILIAFDRIFKHIKSENKEEEIFATGFYIGLAYLCFAPTAIFFIMAYLSFLLYTRTRLRYYLLLITGFMFPIVCMLVFFFWNDGFDEIMRYYILNFPVRTDYTGNFEIGNVLLIIFPSFLLVMFGMYNAFSYRRFINFQIICLQMMLVWMGITLLIIILFFGKTVSSFMLLAPFTAFFISHYLQLTSRKKISEFLFYVLLIFCTQVSFAYLSISFLDRDFINFNHQYAKQSKWQELYYNKKVVVFGEEQFVYKNNKLATPYLDWKLSRSILLSTDHNSAVVHIYKSFVKDAPDVIIDDKHVIPAIFDRIPTLRAMYKAAKYKDVYIRK